MKKRTGLIVLLSAASAGYLFGLRPWHLKWGAMAEEVAAPMPGDEIVPQPRLLSTRAISIPAAPGRIWPWLVQIGFQRGGWYSYDQLEAMAGVADFADGHSARRILPEFQSLQVGDMIKTDPGGGFTVTALEPERLMVLRARIDMQGRHASLEGPCPAGQFEATWVFALHSLDEANTRLTARFRATFGESIPMALFAYLMLEPAVFVMERKMLLGIRQRATG
ncbi:MAG TPA: hypothetical protein VFF78_05145 [Anaerolineaceae bacterium]|nr:hypothetical protein [Anaerolineaceae bacterium]